MNAFMPWRPIPSALLVDPRWLQLTLQERAIFVSLVLSANLEGFIHLPKLFPRPEEVAYRLVVGLGQVTLKTAKQVLHRLEDVGLVKRVEEGLQVDVLQLKDTLHNLDEGEFTENEPSTPTETKSRTEYMRKYMKNKRRGVNTHPVNTSDVNKPANKVNSVSNVNSDVNVNSKQNVNTSDVNKPANKVNSSGSFDQKDLEKDLNTKGNVDVNKKGEPRTGTREKAPTLPIVADQPPPEGTPARTIYNAIVGDWTLAPITKNPSEYASKVIEAFPKLDCVSEIRKACLWMGGQKESKRKRYKDGRAFLTHWLKKTLEDLQDNGSYVTGPVQAAPHSAFSEAAKAPGKFLVHDPKDVFGGKKVGT